MKSQMTHLLCSARVADWRLADAPVWSEALGSCCLVDGSCRPLESAAGAVLDCVADGRRTAVGAPAGTGRCRFYGAPGLNSSLQIANVHDRGVRRRCDGDRSLVVGVLSSADSVGIFAKYDSIGIQLWARDGGCDAPLLRCPLL